MHIDQLFEQVKQQISQSWTSAEISVPANWAQGRTLYGGISASLVYRAAREITDNLKSLRSLNTNFIGPIEPDSPFIIKIETVREGKNTSVVRGDILQNGKVALSTLANFGLDRASSIKIDNHIKHAMEKPNESNFIPMIPNITPSFLAHFDLAKIVGEMPFSSSKTADIHGWMRFKEAPAVFTDAHLVAIIDLWPPTILQMLPSPAPASTMSWNLEFIYPHKIFNNDEWFAYQATTRQASNGYAHTEANIWDEEGALVAISRQVVAVFD